MTEETARLLAQAIEMRDNAAEGLKRLQKTAGAFIEVPDPITRGMIDLADTYVHEHRTINRIVSEATD